ncbi:hypothetical protein GBAR_LOCUS9465, partial [Geodia barretti]
SDNCCNNSIVGGWRNESGRPVYQETDGTTCVYVISLHRKRDCHDHKSGLWRCDIPGEMRSLYIYISNNRSVSMNFTLHTELRASVPEFTISWRTCNNCPVDSKWSPSAGRRI